MTRDDFVDTLMRRFYGRRGTQDTLRNVIIAELLQLIPNSLEMFPELPWFLLGEKTISTTASVDTVALNADYLSLWDDGGFWKQNSDGTETRLVVDDWDWVRDKFSEYTNSELSNAPRYGSVIGTTLYLRPVPDAVYSIKYWQFSKDDLSNLSGSYGDGNGSNTCSWLTYAAEWVLGEVGSIVSGLYLKDNELASNFVGITNVQRQKVMDRTVYELEKLKQRFMEGN